MDAIPARRDRRQGPHLGKAADIAGALALQGGGGGDHVAGTGEPTHPPTGHGPPLGEAVDDEQPLGQIGRHRCQAVVVMARGQQKLINLVTDHRHLGMAAQHHRYRLQLLAVQHHAGGVGGAVEHQQTGAGTDLGFEFLGGKTKPPRRLGDQQPGFGAAEAHHLRVAEPEGGGQQHLITGAQQHLKEVVERLLAAIGDQHLIDRRRHPVFNAQFGRDGLAQGRFAGHRAVAGMARLQGIGSGLSNEGRRVKVRFPRRKAADVLPSQAELIRLGGDGEGERRLQPLGPGR